MRFLIVALALSVSTSACLAEDCRSMPPGPDKKACVMRNHPAAFETKFDRCNQQVEQLGAVAASPGGKKGRQGLMQECMRGRPD
jgi:hypothetical protein